MERRIVWRLIGLSMKEKGREEKIRKEMRRGNHWLM